MASHSESRVFPYPVAQVFDLVADVESYPEFVPFWQDAKITAREQDIYYTDQSIHIGPIKQRFRTTTRLERPKHIEVSSQEGIFSHFAIDWSFAPTGEDSCRVDFLLSCDMKSFLLGSAVNAMLAETGRNLVEAFERRARALYGTRPPP
jgi:coenzyme Q-binding protein COQ10